MRRAAAGLVAHGVARGDVLALRSPNCPEFVVACFAALAAGALVATINPLAAALADITRQADPFRRQVADHDGRSG